MATDNRRITSAELFEKLSRFHPMSGAFADACRENASAILDALRDANAFAFQVADLRSALAVALVERDRAREAIAWALGECGEWPERKDGQGAFYWRSELRKRAGLPTFTYDADRKTLTPALNAPEGK